MKKGRKFDLSIIGLSKRPLKRWTERMWEECFVNLAYWEKHWRKGHQVLFNGILQQGEDFLLGSWCITSKTDCKPESCIRLAYGIATEAPKKETKPSLLDFFKKGQEVNL